MSMMTVAMTTKTDKARVNNRGSMWQGIKSNVSYCITYLSKKPLAIQIPNKCVLHFMMFNIKV